MATLKQKNIGEKHNSEAAQLPGLMQALGLPDQSALPDTPENRYMLPVAQLRPAPDEWNFYKPLGKEKMAELMDSIRQNGLIHAVVVWQPDKEQEVYTILSGHNRVKAYEGLFARLGTPDWLLINAYILRDITEEQAREIIVDSNWVQRTLSPSERTKSICQKYALLGRKKREVPTDGEEYTRSYDIIAEDYQISGKQVQRYVRLGKLIDPLLELIDNGDLTLRAGLKLADFDEDAQNQIYGAILETDFETAGARIAALKKGAAVEEVLAALREPEEREGKKKATATVFEDQLEALMNQEDREKNIKVMFELPPMFEHEFNEMALGFFKAHGISIDLPFESKGLEELPPLQSE